MYRIKEITLFEFFIDKSSESKSDIGIFRSKYE